MSEPNTVKILSCAEVETRKSSGADIILLDVRTGEEWGERHIPGVVHISLQALASKHRELDQTKEIICICERGIRSLHAANFLLFQCGYPNVCSMDGGMSEWTGEVESSYI